MGAHPVSLLSLPRLLGLLGLAGGVLTPALAASADPVLHPRDALVFAQKERTYRVTATTDTPDPLQKDGWWLSQIGTSGLTAPGPGVPVTIVDSGLDIAHPEFAGRADTQP